jgi:antitoxin component of MazEF toxin-antitoxin module
MLNYYRSIQRPRKSYHVNLPKPLIDILDLKKGDEVNITLANDRGEKVVVIRTIPQTTTKEEVKINVVT